MTDPRLFDPNIALQEIRGLIDGSGRLSHEEPHDVLFRLSESIEALDNHISRGGVLPKSWQTDEIVRLANDAVKEAAERYAEAKRGQPMTWAQKLAGSRQCAGGCGMPPAAGDVFCAGCREGHDRG